jgi:hypothetical protein
MDRASASAKLETLQVPPLSLSAAFVPKSVNDEARTVDLIFSTGAPVERYDWNTGARYTEKLALKPENVRLDRLNAGAPLLNAHSAYSLTDIIGVVESASVVGGKGRATVRFSTRADVEPIYQDVRNGIIRAVSVGYRVHRFEETVASKAGALPIRTATDWEPYEISMVPMPADPAATTRSKPADLNTCVIVRSLEDSMSEKNETPEAPKAAETTPAPEQRARIAFAPPSAEEAAQIAQRAELERGQKIRVIVRAAKLGEPFADELLARSPALTEDQTRKVVLDELAKRSAEHEPAPGRVIVGEDVADKRRRGIGAALTVRAGASDLVRRAAKKHPDHPAFAGLSLEPGEFRGMSLLEMARESLEQRGIRTRGLDKMEIARQSILSVRASLIGAQGTSDFAVALENTLHKTLLAAYLITPDTWRRFCAVGSLSDFKPHPRYRMGYMGVLDEVNEAGEFKNKAVSDAVKESVTGKTKGNIISLTRQAIVNDDMGIFNQISAQAGRAAALTIESDVYALLALNGGLGPAMGDGKTMFHADHDNIGEGSEIGVAALDDDRVLMAEQMDPAGNEFLNIRPAVLVLGAGLEGLARVINESQYDVDQSAKAGTRNNMTPNRVQGLFRDIVGTPRVTGTRRYLFADPAEMPCVEVDFLEGNQEPFLEMQDGWRIDGVEWKVREDYGVGAVEFRGAATNAGVEST